MEEELRKEEEERLAKMREEEAARQHELEVQERERIEREQEMEREREEEEKKRKEERMQYLSDKHCAYCSHLIPSKQDGSYYYCELRYSYVKGPDSACDSYEESSRSTLESDLIFSEASSYEKNEKKCAYCSHLIPSKKSEGRYYCDKLSNYILASSSNRTNRCNYFSSSSRSSYESDLMLEDSKTLENYDDPNKHCADCRFFVLDREASNGSGKCTKRNEDRMGDTEECYMYEESGRSSSEANRIYDDAKEVKRKSDLHKRNDDNTGFLAIIAIILVIGAIIVNVFM